MDEGMSHLILLAVPLFVFLGLLIEMAGMARAMVAFLASCWATARRAHYVLVGAIYSSRAFPAPRRRHGRGRAGIVPGNEGARRPSRRFVALLASTGAQTETIPPSLVLITIGSVTGVSISALFSGLLPGVVWRSRCPPWSGGATAVET